MISRRQPNVHPAPQKGREIEVAIGIQFNSHRIFLVEGIALLDLCLPGYPVENQARTQPGLHNW